MKIAIHHTVGTFSDRWIGYCKQNNIPYKIVNAYDSNIVESITKDCDAFMWHFSHGDYRDMLFARQLINSLENVGIRCFPDYHTCWHFDDKVGEKYMLEAMGVPIVKSDVFYTKKEALDWLETASMPLVFKLRGGAAASNVKLAKSPKEVRKLVRKAFGSGFPQFDRLGYLMERLGKLREGRDTLLGVCKALGRLFIPTEYAKMHAPEKGYVYFQEFISNNDSDIRVIVIGNKAFALKRMCRTGDFRTSGSGNIVYSKDAINEECVKIAFETIKKMHAQCVAFDFVFKDDMPLIVETSYGFTADAYDNCEGYWSEDMQWHGGSHFDFCGWMVEELTK